MNYGNTLIDLRGYSHDTMRFGPYMGESAVFTQLGKSTDHQGTEDRHTGDGNHTGKRTARSFRRVLGQYEWDDRITRREVPLYVRGNNIATEHSEEVLSVAKVLKEPNLMMEISEQDYANLELKDLVDHFVFRYSADELVNYSGGGRIEGWPVPLLENVSSKVRSGDASVLFEISKRVDVSRAHEAAKEFSIPDDRIWYFPVGRDDAEFEDSLELAKTNALANGRNMAFNYRHPFRDDEGNREADETDQDEVSTEEEEGSKETTGSE